MAQDKKGPFNWNGPLFDRWVWDWLSLILSGNGSPAGDDEDVRNWRAAVGEGADAGRSPS